MSRGFGLLCLALPGMLGVNPRSRRRLLSMHPQPVYAWPAAPGWRRAGRRALRPPPAASGTTSSNTLMLRRLRAELDCSYTALAKQQNDAAEGDLPRRLAHPLLWCSAQPAPCRCPCASRLAPAQPWGGSLTQRSCSRPGSTAAAAAAGRQPDASQQDSEGGEPAAFNWLPPQAQPVLVRLGSLLKRWLPAVVLVAALALPQLIPAMLAVLAACIVLTTASATATLRELLRTQRQAAEAERREVPEAQHSVQPSGAVPSAAPGAYVQQQPARSAAAPAAAAAAAAPAGSPAVGTAAASSAGGRAGLLVKRKQRALRSSTILAHMDALQPFVQDPQSTLPGSEGGKLPLIAYIVRAAARATREVPALSTSWHNGHFFKHHAVHCSVAVPGPTDLVSLTMRNVDVKTPAGIAAEFGELERRAAEGTLLPDQTAGSSLAIWNLDVYDYSRFAHVIYPPQVCVLTVRTIVDEEGACLECTLTYHSSRVDEEVAERWLDALQACLEDPAAML
ncbi:hypothetical protein ABPG77_005051 [Micractinium sp. CCAP 211/92]